jgi:capsular polysaccharide biosynthesis protein
MYRNLVMLFCVGLIGSCEYAVIAATLQKTDDNKYVQTVMEWSFMLCDV